MKEYNVKITLTNGNKIELTVTEDQAKQNKNIQNYIFNNIIPEREVKTIDVAIWNNNTKKYYNETTYNNELEKLKNNRHRVNITYTFDSGNQEQTRCYIGKSTGWIPCYLEIKKSNSMGGSALLTNCITDIEVLEKTR